MRDEKRALGFSKLMLIVDYAILLLLLGALIALAATGNGTAEISVVISAWIAQIAVSSGFYYWKAKAENLIKLPIQLLQDIPEDMREKSDPNQVIDAVMGIGANN